ncbi:MAG: KEOPS complex subunit Cgi121 [Candidatus Heimdallarchaeaceae archaeon]
MKEQSNNSFTFSFSYLIYQLPKIYSIEKIIELIKTYNLKNKSVTLQVLDPKYIISKKQLEIAIYQTIVAFHSNENIARDKGTELLLRLSGYRQIKKALIVFGIEEQSKYVMFIGFGDSEEEINRSLVKISEEIGFNVKESIQLPVSNIKILKDFYDYNENIDDLEKAAIEKIVTLKLD